MGDAAVPGHRWTRAEYDRMVELGILGEDEHVELIGGRIVQKGRDRMVERRWTPGEIERLVAAGLLRPEERATLAGSGWLCCEPQGSPHATGVDLVADALRATFGSGWIVRTEKPLALGPDSEPEPDVAVVSGDRRDYRDAHPDRAVLVVEVADSSLQADRNVKGSLYARAGVPEYWILNLAARVLEVYLDPVPEPAAVFGWRYARREVLGADRAVVPAGAPGAAIPVADLLP